jgi:hypothetical protein
MRRTGAAMGRGCGVPVCRYPIADLLDGTWRFMTASTALPRNGKD